MFFLVADGIDKINFSPLALFSLSLYSCLSLAWFILTYELFLYTHTHTRARTEKPINICLRTQSFFSESHSLYIYSLYLIFSSFSALFLFMFCLFLFIFFTLTVPWWCMWRWRSPFNWFLTCLSNSLCI